MKLHEILSSLREEKALKQHEVAERIHVAASTVSSYETGSSQPSYPILISLADLYDVSIDFLLGRTRIKLPFQRIEQGFHTESGVFPLNMLYHLSLESKEWIAKLVCILYENEQCKRKQKP